jgi:hypothetical protein
MGKITKSFRTDGVPAEIPKQHLQNICLELYRYINLLSGPYSKFILAVIILQFLFICVQTEQPKGQLQSEHEWMKINKHTQSTKQVKIIITIYNNNKNNSIKFFIH